MQLNAPKQITWIIALILGVVGILASVANIASLSPYALWILALGFVLLLVATVVKGL